MKNSTKKVLLSDGRIIREPKDQYQLLNMQVLKLLNQAERSGSWDFPLLKCDIDEYPDYIALSTQPGYFYLTRKTCLCFYVYDCYFDGLDGIYNAIVSNNLTLLEIYKNRFRGIRYVISPDYSMFGDINRGLSFVQLWKERIVTLWFMLELNAIVIPNISYVSQDTFPLFFSGLETCKVIAFNTKGHIRYRKERNLLKAAIKYAVDNLPLKAIVVYSVCGKDKNCLKVFKYAIDKGIKIIIPNNSLRSRNMQRSYVL